MSDSILLCTTAFHNILFEVATGTKPQTPWLTALHELPTVTHTPANLVPDMQADEKYHIHMENFWEIFHSRKISVA